MYKHTKSNINYLKMFPDTRQINLYAQYIELSEQKKLLKKKTSNMVNYFLI